LENYFRWIEEGSLIEYIRPLSKARRSTQEEIDIALGNNKKGARVFISTIYAGKNKILNDEQNKLITAFLPDDMFYHQTLVCGTTGRGKTVATKYLAQYFVEELGGAVLAINVKEADFLKMNKKSEPKKEAVINEWASLDKKAHPITNFVVYYPAGNEISFPSLCSTRICTGFQETVHNARSPCQLLPHHQGRILLHAL